MPKEETFSNPFKYIDDTRTTCTSLNVMLEKQIEDYWDVDGVRIVRCMDKSHKICSAQEVPEGHTWSVTTTPQKDPFSQCESLQGIRVQVKIEQMVMATIIQLTTRSTERNPTMCEMT